MSQRETEADFYAICPRVPAMSDWTDPVWLAEAYEWIHQRLDRLGVGLTGSIEQPHVRPSSTVLRVPTVDGDCWFKANIPVMAHEAAVVCVLARERPDCVPELLAADLERGWMLMSDGGERLRDVIGRERSLRRWLDVLPAYARLQIDVAGHADEFVEQGAPDRRLKSLASQYEQLLDQSSGIAASELHRLSRVAPRVREMCDQLDSYGIPETIQHDDLDDEQVFVRDGSYLFMDWGDACVSHPFFSMAVTLEGVLAWGLDDIAGSEDIRGFRDAYLQPFTRYVALPSLEEAHTIALRLGWICRALTLHTLASALKPPDREKALKGVSVRLQLFLAGLPARSD
jgi:hypothetical protein